ncbi:hypothetical protein GcM3_203009 [Golovinomyces cichoracearum]|uniref:Uncharacterized protein n=1 Tax=Golovinomyces cichoracearum TaxID=62708 RepID=A0A420HCU2_9PEZI|nr:hypothetical protein GcM3_203009 [Golovinomyces cichoracearum]
MLGLVDLTADSGAWLSAAQEPETTDVIDVINLFIDQPTTLDIHYSVTTARFVNYIDGIHKFGITSCLITNHSQDPISKLPHRKRSRPSDWWAVNQNSSDQQTGDTRPSKRRKSSSRVTPTSEKNSARNSKKYRVEIRDESTENQDNNDSEKNRSTIKPSKDRDVPNFSKSGVATKKNNRSTAADANITRNGTRTVSDNQPSTIRSRTQPETLKTMGKSKGKTNHRKKKTRSLLDQNQGLVNDFENSGDKIGVQNLSKTRLKSRIVDNSSVISAQNFEERTLSGQDLDLSHKYNMSKENHLVSNQNYEGRGKDFSTEFEDELRLENGNKKSDLSRFNPNSIESEESQTSLSDTENQENLENNLNFNSLLSNKKLIAVSNSKSRDVIKSKQRTLPPLIIERISKLLQEVQLPVLVTFLGSRRRLQASTALKSISRSLVRKVSKIISFPKVNQINYKKFLDFQKTQDSCRSLETQLTLALHSNKLLQSALRKELRLLRTQQKKLTELDNNSKRELILRNEIARKLHSVLQTEPDVNHVSLNEDIEFEYEFRNISEAKDFDQNEELSKLIKSICNHVNSIESNIGQVGDFSESIARSKANLQDSLFDHFRGSEYEEIIMGIFEEK